MKIYCEKRKLTHIRESVMLTIPKAIVRMLELKGRQKVDVFTFEGLIIVSPSHITDEQVREAAAKVQEPQDTKALTTPSESGEL